MFHSAASFLPPSVPKMCSTWPQFSHTCTAMFSTMPRIVTTPQDIALLAAKGGIKLFGQVGVPILGIVENMAVHVCSNCGHAEHIFGADGGKKMAAEYQMEYLGALPLDINIRLQADSGAPTVVSQPDSEAAGIYKAVARRVAVGIAEKAKDFSAKFPTISISKNT